MLALGVQMAISFPVRYSLTLTGSGEAFRRLRGAGTAQVGGAVAWQAVVLAERMIASFLPAGTLTAINYGSKILYTMVELLGGSVGTAALPQLSRAAINKAHEEERRTLKDISEISLFLTSPAVVFCLMLAHNIIRLVFERGNFTPAATGLMSRVFFCYCLSLLPLTFIRVLTFYLFARGESGSFLRLSILLYSLNLAFDLLYVGVLRWGAKRNTPGLIDGVGSGLRPLNPKESWRRPSSPRVVSGPSGLQEFLGSYHGSHRGVGLAPLGYSPSLRVPEFHLYLRALRNGNRCLLNDACDTARAAPCAGHQNLAAG